MRLLLLLLLLFIFCLFVCLCGREGKYWWGCSTRSKEELVTGFGNAMGQVRKGWTASMSCRCLHIFLVFFIFFNHSPTVVVFFF